VSDFRNRRGRFSSPQYQHWLWYPLNILASRQHVLQRPNQGADISQSAYTSWGCTEGGTPRDITQKYLNTGTSVIITCGLFHLVYFLCKILLFYCRVSIIRVLTFEFAFSQRRFAAVNPIFSVGCSVRPHSTFFIELKYDSVLNYVSLKCSYLLTTTALDAWIISFHYIFNFSKIKLKLVLQETENIFPLKVSLNIKKVK
jgi:hypothetical protein